MMHRVLPLFLIAVSAYAQYTSAPAGPPPAELSPAIAAALQKDGLRILEGDKPVVEVWFRTTMPSGPATGEQAVSLTTVPHGTLLGAMRVVGRYADRRGNPVKPGVYTLRYSLFPQNGEHQGVAPQRDFLVIALASEDKDLNATPDFKTLMAWSEKAAGRPHPGVFSMWKADSDFAPGFSKFSETDWVYQTKIGDTPVAIILIGKAEG